jgi:tetrahydromethanopterin S-methyltransferase subunit B
MGIEQNIKSIRSHQTSSRAKTAGELKGILAWQKSHTAQNNKQFKQIGDALKSLPSEEVILKSISDNIKVVVNGKIDKISLNVTEIGEHLKQQDVAIEEVNKKIKPVVGSMEWLNGLMKVVLYLGAIAAAIYGIVKLLLVSNIIK